MLVLAAVIAAGAASVLGGAAPDSRASRVRFRVLVLGAVEMAAGDGPFGCAAG